MFVYFLIYVIILKGFLMMNRYQWRFFYSKIQREWILNRVFPGSIFLN